jgi:hypothetical protein
MLTTSFAQITRVGAAALVASSALGSAPSVRISEIRADQPGADADEYFELTGPAGGALDGLTYLVIGDGSSGNNGVVEEATGLEGWTLDEDGWFVAAEETFSLGLVHLVTDLNFENGDNVTHLLVSGFTGESGDDLDADDDGVLDLTPWTAVVDAVALVDDLEAGDRVYCATRLGPEGSGPPFHVYRCAPSLVWRIGAGDPAGGDDTPASGNPPCPCLADLDGTQEIDELDLAELLDAWGPCAGCPADFDRDLDVGAADVVLLLESWGPCPSAPAPGVTNRFDETIVVDATDPGAADRGLIVTHVYATGSTVAVGDALTAVGAAGIEAVNADLYQEPIFGDSLPPDSFFFQFEPALEYDTFVTINRLADDEHTVAAPGLYMDSAGIDGDWFAAPPGDQAEAVDISALTGQPGQAGVLIAQVTLVPCAAAPGVEPARAGFAGTVSLYTSVTDGGTLHGVETGVRFPACPADVDLDGTVGVVDFLVLLTTWGPCPCCRGDIDGDGSIGVTDFLAVMEAWGACP